MILDILSWVFLVAGGLLGIIGGIGIHRFPDFFTRLHAAGITDTLCAALILSGLGLQSGFSLVSFKLVLIFAFQGQVILDNPLHIVLIAIPLVLQTFLIFSIAYGVCWLLKLPHRIAAPAGMIGASNFFELAVAVAVALFGTTSPAALATTVGVLTEVPVMLFLVKIANKTKGRFPA